MSNWPAVMERLTTGGPTTPDNVLPLSEFPEEHQARIAAAVAQPTPPPKMRRVVGGAIPNRAWWEWHWSRGIDPNKRRTPLPSWVVAQVIDRCGNECGICGDPVEEPPHLDHIHPRSRGGKDIPGNLQVAHPTCNLKKGARVA